MSDDSKSKVSQKLPGGSQEALKDVKRLPKGFHEAASAFQEELESKIAVVSSESQKILLPKALLVPFS